VTEPVDTAADRSLQRVLGPVSATSIVIGAIIGVGIFFTPTQVARIAGSAELALLAWIVGGGIAMCGALTFAALGVRYPHSGGQYEILRDAYGTLPGFLFVICNATAVQAGAIAIIALICAGHVFQAVAPASQSAPSAELVAGVALALIVALTLANILGVRWGAAVQNLTVFAKLATLLAIGAVAATYDGGPASAPVAPVGAPSGGKLAVLFAALVPSFFAFGGWQHALWMAGEVRNPRRVLPVAIILGVAIVVVAYVLTNWAFFRLLGYDGVVGSSALAADAVARVWPDWGRRVTAGAVAVSAFGVLNAQLLSGPRLVYRLAADGQFFGIFAKVHATHHTPIPAILLLSLAGAGLLMAARGEIDPIDRLTTGVVFVDGVFFALTGAAIYVFARRQEGRFGFGYPVVPALFVLGELGLLVGALSNPSAQKPALIGLSWIAGATVLFFCIRLFRPHGGPRIRV